MSSNKVDLVFAAVTKAQNDVYNFSNLSNKLNEFVKISFEKVQEGNLTLESYTQIMHECMQAVYGAKGKAPKAKKAPSGYNLFCNQMYRKLKEENPDNDFKAMSQLVASEWKALTQEQKNQFNERSKEAALEKAPKVEKKEPSKKEETQSKKAPSKKESSKKEEETKPAKKAPSKK